MSEPIEDGGPAFPSNECWGMSLRDWFAAHENIREWDNPEAVPSDAMCCALAGPKPDHGWSCHSEDEWLAMLRWDARWRAAIKYIRADAMIEARKAKV